MKNKITILLIACIALTVTVFAQTAVPHASPEVRQKARDRADYGTLRRKIGELKEFAEEKKKIPALKKDNSKEIVKVYATVDSVDIEDTTHLKTLTGYITQQVGDNVANAYEVTFDRATKRITAVKRTGESIEPEGEEAKEKPAHKKVETATAKPAPKKKKTGDDDDEEEDEKEEKPTKEKDE